MKDNLLTIDEVILITESETDEWDNHLGDLVCF